MTIARRGGGDDTIVVTRYLHYDEYTAPSQNVDANAILLAFISSRLTFQYFNQRVIGYVTLSMVTPVLTPWTRLQMHRRRKGDCLGLAVSNASEHVGNPGSKETAYQDLESIDEPTAL